VSAPAARTWLLRTRRWSLRLDVRSVLVGLVVAALCGVMVVLAVSSGSYTIPVREVLDVLLGRGSGGSALVILEWRLPRALLALVLGAALAMSGAIFQSLTRNPLGSPDVIGFASGSYTGALLALTVLGGGYVGTAVGSLVGGLVTALVVFALSYRRGVQSFRLIIVGIGVAAMLGAFNSWLLLRSPIETAMRAGIWGSGSLNGLSAADLPVAVGVLAVLLPLALALGPPLRQLELGDDAAAALGTRPTRVRLLAITLGVALTAAVTATAGPIAFIALVAPQIARRVTRSSGIALVPGALVGALLLVTADFLAQRVFAPVQLPVGVVTVSIGGLYFVHLLVREYRAR
jgi:iron complex transport system permease protein